MGDRARTGDVVAAAAGDANCGAPASALINRRRPVVDCGEEGGERGRLRRLVGGMRRWWRALRMWPLVPPPRPLPPLLTPPPSSHAPWPKIAPPAAPHSRRRHAGWRPRRRGARATRPRPRAGQRRRHCPTLGAVWKRWGAEAATLRWAGASGEACFLAFFWRVVRKTKKRLSFLHDAPLPPQPGHLGLAEPDLRQHGVRVGAQRRPRPRGAARRACESGRKLGQRGRRPSPRRRVLGE